MTNSKSMTEPRLIDANEALVRMNEGMNWVYDLTDLPDFLADCPTVDAKPVVHARWIYHDTERGTVFTCSNCDYTPELISEETPYCPYCGATMDKEE